MKKTKYLKLTLDIILVVALITLYSKNFFGMNYHELVGLGVLVPIIVHIFINIRTIKGMCKNFIRVPATLKVGLIVDIMLMLIFIWMGISGILISKTILTGISSGSTVFKTFHVGIAALSVILLGIHMGLHFCRKEMNTAIAIAITLIALAAGIYGFCTSSMLRWISMPLNSGAAGKGEFKFDQNNVPDGMMDFDFSQFQNGDFDPSQMPNGDFDPSQKPSGNFDVSQIPSGDFDMSQIPGGFNPGQSPSGDFDMSQVPSGDFDPSQKPSGNFDPSQFQSGNSDSGQLQNGDSASGKKPGGNFGGERKRNGSAGILEKIKIIIQFLGIMSTFAMIAYWIVILSKKFNRVEVEDENEEDTSEKNGEENGKEIVGDEIFEGSSIDDVDGDAYAVVNDKVTAEK